MTFKHVKFEDSPIMRSLEKVAREKGLVKSEPLQKAAAAIIKKADIVPTSNLMENIFKLCNGMRAEGLEKEAMEVEMNFLNYKRAQTLYEAHKEKGEDLIHAAHPDGSHKLEGVEGEEATFEDILDRHAKILQKIEKMPTGKLSSAAQIVRAVKMALGQSADEFKKTISDNMKTVMRNMAAIQGKTGELTISVDEYAKIINSLASNPTIDNLKKLKDELDRLHTRLDPSSWLHYTTFGATGLSEETWAVVKALVDNAKAATNSALSARIQMKQQEADQAVNPTPKVDAPVKPDVAADMSKKISGLAAQYSSLANLLSSDDPKDAEALQKTKDWLKGKAIALQGILSQFQGEADKESVMSNYQATLTKYETALNKIRQEWA